MFQISPRKQARGDDMSLLHLPIGRDRNSSTRRRPKAFRPSLLPGLESLEQRTVLSAAAASAMVAPAAMQSPLAITGANITNLAVQPDGNLLATLNLTGTLTNKGGVAKPFTLPNLQLPITLGTTTATTPTTAAPNGCPILHLSLEIPDLNVLGLHVRLDNCTGGPVTVDLTAVPGGGLLGDLLCGGLNNVLGGITGLLNGAGGLNNLAGLTDPLTGNNVLTELTGGLTTILNGLLTDLTTGSTSGTGGTMGSGGGQTIPSPRVIASWSTCTSAPSMPTSWA